MTSVTCHGKTGYTQGCRCDTCRAGQRDYCREYQRRRRATKDYRKHGTRTTYSYGCRCDACTRAHTEYCTKYHRERAASGNPVPRGMKDHNRRARMAGVEQEPFTREEVFEADGYRCHLCGKKTGPTKKVPHPKAPTIDHVVPLSKGGEHSMANCRTAHHGCNLAKGNRGGGEQLAIAL